MITIFNRVKLFTDSSAEEAAKVWMKLKENGVPYEMKTVQNTTSIGKTMRGGMAGGYNGGLGYSNFADAASYVYVIYVRKRDLARAREMCELND